MKNKITEILSHDVSWYVENPTIKELDEISEAHIIEDITQGYTEGKLCISCGKGGSKESWGWWHIINWKSIALDLYNELNHAIPWLVDLGAKDGEKLLTKKKEAIKRFDKEWTY